MSIHIIYSTNLTKPNRKRPKPDFGFAFGVWSGSARADPERTMTGRKANPNFRSEPVKRTKLGSALRNRAVKSDKLPWPMGASTNQKAGCVDQSARQTIIQCKSVCFFSSTCRLNLCILLNNVLRKNPQLWQSGIIKFHFSYNN